MLRRSDGLVALDEGGSGQNWVVARGFCAYTLIDASAIPASRRKAFAAIALQRWSPFPDPGHHIEWAGPLAMVWAWSNGQVRDLRGGVAVAPRQVWPESVFRGEACADGACLIADDEGVEGRVWRDAVLVASQWWPEPPSLAEWNAFLRGVGRPAMQALPDVEAPPLATTPWTRHRAEALNDLAARHRGLLQAAAVALAVALVAAPLAASLRLAAKTYMLDRVIEREAQGVRPILEARESAERDLAAIDGLLALRPPARQLQLMAALFSALPGTDWQLLEWRMPDSASLGVTVQMSNPDPAAIVRALERSGVLTDVSVDLGRARNEVTIKARVRGAPPAAGVSAKASI